MAKWEIQMRKAKPLFVVVMLAVCCVLAIAPALARAEESSDVDAVKLEQNRRVRHG